MIQWSEANKQSQVWQSTECLNYLDDRFRREKVYTVHVDSICGRAQWKKPVAARILFFLGT
jgi:hypothetical protein